MAETIHTPGPWSTGENGDACAKGHAICGADRFVIAKVYGRGYPVTKGWSPESQADATLLAAAPELLALVKEVLPVLPPRSRLKRRARALIAKAEGR